jgi:L-lysine 6-transaminase
MNTQWTVPPYAVVADLERHVLVDGFRIVLDLQKSQGSRLVDASNHRELIDFYGFYGSLPVGFNHPYFDLPEVQSELLQAAKTKVANCDVYTTFYATFVDIFSRVAGLPPLERYFFIDGGALAVENALKAAMDWKVRKNLATGRGERGTDIIHFQRAFHGRSGYTMSLTNTDPRKTDYFAKFPWPRVSTPCLDFSLPEALRREEVREREKRAETEIQALLARSSADVAALIIEPIQGEGGDNHFRPEWFRTLRRLCDENDVLLIFDEVQCGLGLTGRTWCCEHFGVLPDLLAFGKKTQVCGVMAGPRLDEVPDNVFRLPSRISSTWGGNLTDMVRSTHYLRIIEQEQLVENAAAMGRLLVEGLQRLSASYPFLTAIRGRGLMIALDLPNREERDQFYRGLYERGLLAIRCGERSIRFRPVLDIGQEVIETGLSLFEEQCRRMHRSV